MRLPLHVRSAWVVAALVAACGPRSERGIVAGGEAAPLSSRPSGISWETAPQGWRAAGPAAPPAPVAPPAPAAPVRRPGAYANLDPADDYVVGPPDAYDGCEAELAAAGVKFRAASLPVHVPGKSKIACGAPQVVTYLRGPANIAYNAAPVVTCALALALALASWERIVQNEASAAFGSPVARIDQLGTYNCREMAAYPGWVSEHSYANAIDIGRFVLKNGKSIEVLRDFDVGDAPPTRPAASFLRAVSRRANDEDVFSHVLTPFFDALHKNHFHLDLARYRTDGTRPHRGVN
jgi:hypothetical protein